MNTLIRTWQLDRPGHDPQTVSTEQVLHELRAAGTPSYVIYAIECDLELLHDRGANANVLLGHYGWHVTQVTP